MYFRFVWRWGLPGYNPKRQHGTGLLKKNQRDIRAAGASFIAARRVKILFDAIATSDLSSSLCIRPARCNLDFVTTVTQHAEFLREIKKARHTQTRAVARRARLGEHKPFPHPRPWDDSPLLDPERERPVNLWWLFALCL